MNSAYKSLKLQVSGLQREKATLESKHTEAESQIIELQESLSKSEADSKTYQIEKEGLHKRLHECKDEDSKLESYVRKELKKKLKTGRDIQEIWKDMFVTQKELATVKLERDELS